MSESQQGVFIKTFGCQMNEYDSEKILALLGANFRSVGSPDDAHLIIVNTCSVRERAEHKLFSLLGTFQKIKRDRPELIVGVGGCVAQQEGAEILRRSHLVDFVVGTHNLSLVPALVERARRGVRRQVAVDYREEWEDLPPDFAGLGEHRPVRALVAIQRGCNKACSFCVVPTTRGSETSRAPEEIEREVRHKIRAGAREVLLLGQTVNSYGLDLAHRYPFERLVERLAAIPDLERIRFTSPHPAEVRPSFIELYSRIPALCPHIHLPLQSGSDRILKAMNRNYRVRRYREIVLALRAACPEIALTSDIIVGFPTETEDEFAETMALLEEVRYQNVFSFAYSRRPNTAARERFGPEEEISTEVQQARLHQLQSRQEEISHEVNSRFLGKRVEVLVEERSKHISSAMRGRNPQNLLVELRGGDAQPGQTLLAEVDFAGPHLLRGRVVEADRPAGLNP